MKQSEYLFFLIKSLNKTEKRYFKLYALRHIKGEENNYVKLFDYIDKQEAYDEKKLIAFFSKEKFINQLSVAKNYLYGLVLKSMHSFHANSSVDASIWEMFHNAEFLRQKGLWQQSVKILKKIKELCIIHEKFAYLIEVIRVEQKVYKSNSIIGVVKDKVNNFNSEVNEAIAKLSNITAYDHLSNELYLMSSDLGQARSDKHLKIFDKFISDSLLTNESNALSLQALRYFYLINMIARFNKHDNDGAYKFSSQLMNLYKKDPSLKEIDFESYRDAIIGHAVLSRKTKRREEFFKCLKELQSMRPRHEREKVMLLERYYNLFYSDAIEDGKFEEAFKKIDEFEENYRKNINFISPVFRVILPYQAACICFGSEKYSSALKWLNKVLNSEEINIRTDIIAVVKIFDLIIHYELGNDDLIDYKVRSTYRFLYSRERLYAFENIILRFIKRRLSVHNSPAKLMEAFKELKWELEKAFKDPIEEKILEYFDFMAWLDSKIEKKPFAEMVRRKLRRKKDK